MLLGIIGEYSDQEDRGFDAEIGRDSGAYEHPHCIKIMHKRIYTDGVVEPRVKST